MAETPADPDDLYLIWSHEHRMWWGPARRGYVERMSDAGTYRREAALAICTGAIAGTAQKIGALPELPVRLADVQAMADRFEARYPGVLAREPWH